MNNINDESATAHRRSALAGAASAFAAVVVTVTLMASSGQPVGPPSPGPDVHGPPSSLDVLSQIARVSPDHDG